MIALDKKTLFLGAGAVGAAALLLWLGTRYGKQAGQAVGRGVTDAATGLVLGVGEGFGLPDTSDAQVVAQGRAALERGDYFEASRKLPAGEFLGGLGSRLGIWIYEVTHPEEAGPPRDASRDRANRTLPEAGDVYL